MAKKQTTTLAKISDSVSWAAKPAGKAVEGSPIALGAITGKWTSLTIGAIPLGAVLADGAGHSFTAAVGATAVDVTGWSLGSLTITTPTDANFTLTAKTGTGKVASEAVVVNPLAPELSWASSVEGIEGTAIALGSLVAKVGKLPGDGAGTAMKSIVIAGLPVGAKLSDGHGHSFTATATKTSATVTAWTLSSLSLVTASDTNVTLTVTATESDAQGNTSTARVTETVVIDPLAPTVGWAAAPAGGTAGVKMALGAVTVSLGKLAGDGAGNTLKSLTVGGLPAGAVLSDGAGHSFTAPAGGGTADITGWSLTTLGLVAPAAGTVTLVLTATERDAEGNTSTAGASETVSVVAGVDLAPTLSAGAPSAALVEAAAGVAGVATSVVHLSKADPDGVASYDTAGWTALGGGAFGQAAAHGSVVLDTVADTLTYQLDNSLAATDALAGGQAVSDSVTVTVVESSGTLTASTQVAFGITGSNDAPVFVSTGAAGSMSGQLVATDAEGDAITYGLAAGQSATGTYGSVAVDAAGVWSYAPDPALIAALPAGTLVSDSFAVQADDGNGGVTTDQIAVSFVSDGGALPPPSPFTVIDPAAANAGAITSAIMGTTPGITADLSSLSITAGSSSAMFYDGSLTSLGIGAGILITSGTTPGTSNTVGYFGQDNGMAGSPALDAIVRTVYPTTPGLPGPVSYDATSITFNFNVSDPTTTGISLNAVFGSDEFPEWVDLYVDIGAVLVNGVNVAYFNNDPMAPLSVIGGNLASNYFIDNTANLDPATSTAIPGVASKLPIEYDGISHPLAIYAPVHQGLNTIEIAIADTGDHIYDSGLFISNLKATSAPTSGVVLDVPETEGDDSTTGTAAAESFDAKGGNDSIDGGGGNDIILGGAGDDTAMGGDGNDFLDGGTGHNLLSGGAGDDVIQHTAGTGVDTIDGGTGSNTLALNDTASLAADHVDLSNPGVVQTLNDGTSFVNIEVLNYQGGSGNDVVIGGAGADAIDGGAGNDTLTGGGGNDTITGGAGTDTAVFSGSHGQYAITTIGAGLYQVADLRAGAPDGVDQVSGVEQFAFADGTFSIDALLAYGVTITGTAGDNTINATTAPAGQPLVTDNGDTISGLGGDDHITAGAGADVILGGTGNDFINGGAGNDTITAGAGNDEITGGLGADLFIFQTVSDSPPAGADVILDFSQAQGDKIDLSQIGAFSIVSDFTGHPFQLTVTQHGDGYLVQGDTTGGGIANFALQVDTNAMLTIADFVH